jgi:hypothetical protein
MSQVPKEAEMSATDLQELLGAQVRPVGLSHEEWIPILEYFRVQELNKIESLNFDRLDKGFGPGSFHPGDFLSYWIWNGGNVAWSSGTNQTRVRSIRCLVLSLWECGGSEAMPEGELNLAILTDKGKWARVHINCRYLGEYRFETTGFSIRPCDIEAVLSGHSPRTIFESMINFLAETTARRQQRFEVARMAFHDMHRLGELLALREDRLNLPHYDYLPTTAEG